MNTPLDEDGNMLYRMNIAVEDNKSFRDHRESERQFVAPSFSWELSPDTRLLVQAEVVRNRQTFDRGVVAPGGNLGRVSRSAFYGEPSDGPISNDNETLQAELEHDLNEVWTLRLASHYKQGRMDGYATEAAAVAAQEEAAALDVDEWLDDGYCSPAEGIRSNNVFRADPMAATRHGEASNPGPGGPGDFDDPDADPFAWMRMPVPEDDLPLDREEGELAQRRAEEELERLPRGWHAAHRGAARASLDWERLWDEGGREQGGPPHGLPRPRAKAEEVGAMQRPPPQSRELHVLAVVPDALEPGHRERAQDRLCQTRVRGGGKGARRVLLLRRVGVEDESNTKDEAIWACSLIVCER